MPIFLFEAIDKNGQLVRGKDEALHQAALTKKLRSLDLTIVNVKEDLGWKINLGKLLGASPRLPLFPLMVMMRQLATLVKAGVPMVKTLENLTNQGLSPRVDTAIATMQNDICSGYSLSQAFENQGNKFPPVTTPLIKAGEIAGQLDIMLLRLADYYEKDMKLRRAWQQAATYPVVILTFCSLLTIGTVSYIFPIFITLFKGFDLELPLSTRALISITETASDPTIVIPALTGCVLLFLLFRQYMLTPIGNRQCTHIFLGLPYLGPLISKIALSRVARTLSTMLASGISTLTALRISGAACENSVIQDAVDHVAEELKQGARFSEVLAESKQFPPLFTQMVEAGEQSGRLPDMLHKVANFFDEEVMVALAAFTTMIEPVMIGIMGLLVLFVLLAVFQPIYQLVGSF